MTKSQIPTDKLYQQGVPANAKKIVGGLQLDSTESSTVQKDVDWNNVVEQDKDKGYATASATSHYHYQKISHLLLCDHVLIDARGVPEPVQNIAKLLVQQNAKETDAWGKYMTTSGGGGAICEEQREYYQLLFNQQEVLPVLLGIQTINLAADTSYEEFYKTADPVFEKLASGFAEENEIAYNDIRTNFRKAIQPLSLEDRMRLLQNVAQQVDLCQIIMKNREEDIFAPLSSTVDKTVSRAGKKIKTFYNEIGLTDGIL